MSPPVLITGATGFLGHTLCPYLLKHGYRLRALVRPTGAWEFLRPLGVELAWGDIRDADALRPAVQGCRAIVHAAAKFRFWGDSTDFFATNVDGTKNVLETARRVGVERFVHVSTIAVVGKPRPTAVIDETYPPHPRDNYQRSKLEAEKLALRYHQAHQVPALILRPGAIYGPGGRYGFNRLFFEDPLKGIPVQVHRGRHISFPVYVLDVARSIRLALERGRPGEVYNISGRSLSHREINRTVDRVLGYRILRLNAPAWAMVALARVWTWLSRYSGREPYYPVNLAPYVFGDWAVSIEKARRELGFVPTPFEEGARATLAWYQQIGVGPTHPLMRLVVHLTSRKALASEARSRTAGGRGERRPSYPPDKRQGPSN